MVEAALRAVGQTFSTLGYQDPRLQPSGKLDIRLQRQLQAYSKEDPPPARVKPIPLQILQHVVALCARGNDPKLQAISHMIILGFFFLLRPGEYAFTITLTQHRSGCAMYMCFSTTDALTRLVV
jgi:hypothetical protein